MQGEHSTTEPPGQFGTEDKLLRQMYVRQKICRGPIEKTHQTWTLASAIAAVTHWVIGNEEHGLAEGLSVIADGQTDSGDSCTGRG